MHIQSSATAVKMSVDETNNIGISTCSPQSSGTRGPVVLHYELQNMTRRPTRAEIMALGAPTVIGNDSTTHKEPHPGQWTLVKDINMESREPQKVCLEDPFKYKILFFNIASTTFYNYDIAKILNDNKINTH